MWVLHPLREQEVLERPSLQPHFKPEWMGICWVTSSSIAGRKPIQPRHRVTFLFSPPHRSLLFIPHPRPFLNNLCVWGYNFPLVSLSSILLFLKFILNSVPSLVPLKRRFLWHQGQNSCLGLVSFKSPDTLLTCFGASVFFSYSVGFSFCCLFVYFV